MKDFADAINAGIFGGKMVILPEQIREIDSSSNYVFEDRKQLKPNMGQQYRDVLKAVVHNTNFCIIGIENQSDVHYVFPVRNMLYDAAAYKKQWNKIQRMHREKKDLKGAEFLSGFSKADFLQAVVTLVIYYGTEPWDGAKDLHSLIDWSEMPEELKAVVPNYSIYILELNKYENLEDFKSDLKTVCRFIQSSGDAQKLEKMLEEHREEFEDMAEDTYDLIGAFGNMEKINELKDECKKKDGGYNMCKGMEDWLKKKEEEGLELGRNEGLELGRSEGLERGIKVLIETCDELGVSKEDTLLKIVDKFSLDEMKAKEYLERYWK